MLSRSRPFFFLQCHKHHL